MDAPMWQKAASFAARAHTGQLRKDGATPYVAHVFRVAMTVRDLFGCDDPVALVAALLHDTIEDTTTDYDDLREAFGADVADLVAALTKNAALPEEEREPEYDARLAAADWRARLIKLADTYDNLSDTLVHQGQPEYPKLEKAIGKARRALELARADAAWNPTMARAMAMVHELAGGETRPGQEAPPE